jgi:hypothetical protein
MHIAIDDTYSSNVNVISKYVTSNRRTNVAICFQDEDVDEIRTQLSGCLDEVRKILDIQPTEFHFVEIVNCKGLWSGLGKDRANRLVESFVHIYNMYKWPVLIQTIDDRTFKDHGLAIGTNLENLNPTKRDDQSLFLLLLKIRKRFKETRPLTLILDEGRGKPGQPFGSSFFPEWGKDFKGYFASSTAEPLLQLADFIAYVINRSTNLLTKATRNDHENEFLRILGNLKLNSEDVVRAAISIHAGQMEFDAIHLRDRQINGLESQSSDSTNSSESLPQTFETSQDDQ